LSFTFDYVETNSLGMLNRSVYVSFYIITLLDYMLLQNNAIMLHVLSCWRCSRDKSRRMSLDVCLQAVQVSERYVRSHVWRL